MALKKSYKGFVLWMIGFLAALVAVAFIPAGDETLPIRLIMLLMAWSMVSMSFIIWKTEYVYWINGVTYEDAVKAGHERRKEFARRHLVIFLRFALLHTAVALVMTLLGWSAWIDFTFGNVGLIVAAIRTTPIKL